MSTLTIDAVACQQCGVCVEICPMGLISTRNDDFPVITEENEARWYNVGIAKQFAQQVH